MRKSQQGAGRVRRGAEVRRGAGKKSTVRSGRAARSNKPPQPAQQGEFEFRSWGGARRGAGRKPAGARALVPHDSRPAHKARFPVLVTTRVRPGLPSLRRPAEAAAIRNALASATLGGKREDGERAHFHVVHHSIQSNHLHLIVEASDRCALSGGMRGLLVRIARALNRLWGRSGSVFADRFHERALLNPRQVRNALVYVLQNLRKHGIHLSGPDPFSSGPEFDGWLDERAAWGGAERPGAPKGGGAGGATGLSGMQRAARGEGPQPKTWLLGVGWQRHGLIDPHEVPRAH